MIFVIKHSPRIQAVVCLAMESCASIFLRGLTLSSKFFLIVYLAKVLSPERVGEYGLLSVGVGYALYLLGLDFYTYAHRELFSQPRTKWGQIIHNQVMFYVAVYLIVLPILLFIFVAGWLPWKMIGWFYVILVSEHLSMESYRLLVACNRLTLANVALFLRGGAWVIPVVLFFWIHPNNNGLAPVWLGWSIGAAVSVLVAVLTVRKIVKFEMIKTDWLWIRRGARTAFQFFLGTLALRGLFTFDRYFLDMYAGRSTVGVYTFYMSFATALLAFCDAGVVSRLYPCIVTAYRSGNISAYREYMKKLTIGILCLFLLFASFLLVAIEPILHYIARDVYLNHVIILWILLIAVGIYSLGLVPHYALYARNRDRAVVVSSIFSVVVFVVAAINLAPLYGPEGMAFSVLVGMVCLGGGKLFFWLRFA